jgi:hypothetical protein
LRAPAWDGAQAQLEHDIVAPAKDSQD